jgi:hypothetical protein
MQLDTLRDHILKTYTLLRVGMAGIGIFFPLVLWLVGLIVGVQLQGSISAYYHTPMRNVFVGSLFAIGAFLYLYKGVTTRENIVLNFAGVFAVLVALLPPGAPPNLECETFTAAYLHGISAILFFGAITYTCFVTAPETLPMVENESRRERFAFLYKLCGIGMIVLPLLSALLLYLLNETNSIVYFVELLAIWAFSAYWIIKTIEISGSQIEEKSMNIMH